jgi:hypothetical protein
MLDFYFGAPAWARALAAVAVIGIGVVLMVVGAEGRPQQDEIMRSDGTTIRIPQMTDDSGTKAAMFKIGVAVAALGGILLFTAGGRKKDDRYNF